mgnify:FL=1
MDKQQIIHDLAIVYANSKMIEFNLDKRSAIACGNVSVSVEEIQYLKSAYDFAIKNLSE